MDNAPKEQPEEISIGQLTGTVLNWRTYVIYVLLAISLLEGLGLIWQRGTVAETKAMMAKQELTMKDLKISRDIARSNADSCQLKMDQQNKSIADSDAKLKKIEYDLNQLQQRINHGDFYKPVLDVKKQPTPKTCKDALDFINRNIP
jgi:septal ring factor EnvC (AmiA/AmiB activator)